MSMSRARKSSGRLQACRRLPSCASSAVSALYGSKPFGPVAQPDFVNAVVGALTGLGARPLLAELLSLEHRLGRPALHQKWGPRVIDLDLLVYAGERASGGNLELPHRGIRERNFVLLPLADIAPDLQIPGLGRAAELAAGASREGIWLL